MNTRENRLKTAQSTDGIDPKAMRTHPKIHTETVRHSMILVMLSRLQTPDSRQLKIIWWRRGLQCKHQKPPPPCSKFSLKSKLNHSGRGTFKASSRML